MSDQVPKTDRGTALRVFLRIAGSISLTAVIFVFVPYSWMDAIHTWLGMGSLPAEPIVGYLARSTSAFYALLGGLFWVVSFDLVRHRPVMVYLGVVFALFGAALLAVDWRSGMPLLWKVVEGPAVITFGLVMLLLTRAIGTTSSGGIK